ncbi:hypothetical protein Z945_2890 [Sulfitobacter noctilucae]|uniref:hypothetical protein n=1 Tax=Sulfitobacter noctilucae TaxID=1342302 RepID=UPI00046A07A6|nr:hypothetical protein [Sulfitobacter noctilucae]KIN74992.1 hypothetical protein Z945_2890 [Sulfitobacter noctilucae]
MVLLAVTLAILLLLAGTLALRVPISLLTRNIDMPPAVLAVQGSVGDGRALLEGGYALRWDSRLLMLPLPHLRSDTVLEGGDTRLTGWASAGLRGFAVVDLSGRAGPGLARLIPGAWTCEMSATVRDVSLRWGWRDAAAGGNVATPAGICTEGTRQANIPSLQINLSQVGKDGLATLSSDGQPPMARIRLGRDRIIDIAIEPTAAEIFTALPRGGPITLQLPF